MVKNKTDVLENNMSNIKNQFFSNLSEAEEFLTKKYEGLFRIINSSGMMTSTSNSSN